MATIIGKDEKGDEAYIGVYKEKDGKVRIRRLWSEEEDEPVILSAEEAKQLIAEVERCLKCKWLDA